MEWINCKDRLPDKFDDTNYLVFYREKYDHEEEWSTGCSIVKWLDRNEWEIKPKHDGKRVISYNFAFDWDIDEGQNIEITHWTRSVVKRPDGGELDLVLLFNAYNRF
jgi:hypothetical protein